MPQKVLTTLTLFIFILLMILGLWALSVYFAQFSEQVHQMIGGSLI